MIALIRENHGGECSGIDGCADRNRCEEATDKQKDQRKRKKNAKQAIHWGINQWPQQQKKQCYEASQTNSKNKGQHYKINNIIYYDGHYNTKTQKEANYGSKKPPISNKLHRQEPAKEQNMQIWSIWQKITTKSSTKRLQKIKQASDCIFNSKKQESKHKNKQTIAQDRHDNMLQNERINSIKKVQHSFCYFKGKKRRKNSTEKNLQDQNNVHTKKCKKMRKHARKSE